MYDTYNELLHSMDEADYEFLFGPEDLLEREKFSPDSDPKTFLSNLQASEKYLYLRAALLRDFRRSMLMNKSFSVRQLRALEDEIDWQENYPLPPAREADPFGIDSYLSSTRSRHELIRYYLDDLLKHQDYEVTETSRDLIDFLDEQFDEDDEEYIERWSQEYHDQPYERKQALSDYQQHLLKSNAFIDFECDYIGMDFLVKALWDLKKADEFTHIFAEAADTARYKSLNMAFVAERGKGKSTVVQYVGNAMRRLGLLERGHVVPLTLNSIAETTLGGDEENIQQAFDAGEGGIVFVDEADTLATHLSRGQKRSPLIQALNSLAEERRAHTCLIVAVYPENVEVLLGKDTDQGFRSRFGNRVYHFPDYTTKDFVDMFELEMGRVGFSVDNDQTRSRLWDFISNMRKMQEKSFANGRTIRDFVQQVNSVLAERIPAYSTESRIVTLSDINAAIRDFENKDKPKKVDVQNEINPFRAAANGVAREQERGTVIPLSKRNPGNEPR